MGVMRFNITTVMIKAFGAKQWRGNNQGFKNYSPSGAHWGINFNLREEGVKNLIWRVGILSLSQTYSLYFLL